MICQAQADPRRALNCSVQHGSVFNFHDLSLLAINPTS